MGVRFYFLRIQCPKMAEETVAEPPPSAPAAPEVEEAPKGEKACMDLTEFPIKNDYFEGLHMLPETVEKIESAPNFRQVNGFPVFGVGQPAEDGFVPILEKTKSSPEEKPGKILWFNFRKEPVVYINGVPILQEIQLIFIVILTSPTPLKNWTTLSGIWLRLS